MSNSKLDMALAQLQEDLDSFEKNLIQRIQGKDTMSDKLTESSNINQKLPQTPIAIVGMASLLPKARNLQEYWTNIIAKIDCITDVPASHWNVDDYYDPDPRAPDKTYCKKGGFIPHIDFNPMEFGLPPNILEVTDVSQLLSLVVAKEAMEDAGYGKSREFNRERTGVILGSALGKQLGTPLSVRLQYPIWEKVLKSSGLSDQDTKKIVEKIKLAYVQWNENAFPGMLANVIAGRIANRLDLGGTNCVVDAACASSLGALKMAMSELSEHRADMMLTGGVDTDNSLFAYICFSKTPAISPSQTIKPFDAESDGMMLGEGIGMLVLKRLEDAKRDNDTIYAVIKGIGTSSDGRYKSIYAPRPEGQAKALKRAYEDAGFSPTSVSLIEAHGTGTRAGDPSEFKALKDVFSENNPKKQYVALGTVKSQIGHTKAAAGAASLIKTALALHHKILPPTINITNPNPTLDIDNSPFYLNTESRPWIRAQGDGPRRAGVSSFGFGGTNYHVVLEEYEQENNHAYRLHHTSESILLSAPTPEQLLARCEDTLQKLQFKTGEEHYQELIDSCKAEEIPVTEARVGFVADSLIQACRCLQKTINYLKKKPQAQSWNHPQGIYYRDSGIKLEGKVVALFSGQGSQYLEMGRELVMNFPCLRQTYGYMDSLFLKDSLKPVSEKVFPAPVFDTAQRHIQAEALQRTDYAQPAIGAFSVGLYKILQQAGFKPDFIAGHSFGELTALWAAEVLSDEDYFFLVKARGQAMATPDDPNFDPGAMLAVNGEVNRVKAVIDSFPQVTIANFNSNHQVVLAGSTAEIAKVKELLTEKGYSATLLPVSAAFHTPLIGHAQKVFAQASEAVRFKKAKIPVYTNVTGERYPTEPQDIKNILGVHSSKSVLFKQEIETIYNAGGYCFVEFGPRSILTHLVKDILGDKPHVAVALNASRQQDSDRQLRQAVIQLRVAGLPLKNLDPYQIEPPAPKTDKKRLNVRLNCANYVSEKTKKAFEKALQDGHQVTSLAQDNGATHGSTVETSLTQMLTNGDGSSQSNGHTAKANHQQSSSTKVVKPSTPSLSNGHRSSQSNSYTAKANHQQSSSTKVVKPSTPSLSNGHRSSQSNSYTAKANHQRSSSTKVVTPPTPSQSNGHRSSQSNSYTAKANHQRSSSTKVVTPPTPSLSNEHRSSQSNGKTAKANHQQSSSTKVVTPSTPSLSNGHRSSQSNGKGAMAQNPRNRIALSPFIQPTSRLRPMETSQSKPTSIPTQPTQKPNGHLVTSSGSSTNDRSDAKPALALTQPALESNMPSTPTLSVNSQRLLESLEYSLKLFSQHQGETLQVHGQYLNNQLEYAKTFFQLMQQQHSLFGNSNGTDQQAQTKQVVLQSLERSMMQFHQQQAQTLNVHEQYLNHQVDYTKNFFQLVKQQYQQLLTGEVVDQPVLETAVGNQLVGNQELTKQPTPTTVTTSVTSAQDSLNNLPGTTKLTTATKPKHKLVDQQDSQTSDNGEVVKQEETVKQNLSDSSSSSRAFITVPRTTLVKEPETQPALSNVSTSVEESLVTEVKVEPTAKVVSSASAATAINAIRQTLLDVVSEKTGYPAEMLELDMDMEADLGIDSIKRVEILGALQEMYPDLPQANPEQLGELRTLGQIVEYLQSYGSKVLPVEPKATTDTDLAQMQTIESEPVESNEVKPVGDNIALENPTPLPAIDVNAISQNLLDVVSEKTGYPAEMLELDMDMEADLGIDSIKRVEILGALQEMYPDLPQANPEQLGELRTLGQIVEYLQSYGSKFLPVQPEATTDTDLAQMQIIESEPVESNEVKPVGDNIALENPTPLPAIDVNAIGQTLLDVVSEKTGYPAEMLELDMDMEADLGIDSIKRVEILGALQEMYPDLPQANPEQLGELRTLGQIVEYLQQQTATTEKKKFQQQPSSEQLELDHNIPRCLVKLKTLPEPDSLDFALPDKHIVLLTDDGSLTTSKLAQSLTDRDWKVVVLSFPQSLIAEQLPLPKGVSRIVLNDLSEEHLKQQLAAITANYGSVAAFIHLNPALETGPNHGITFLDLEKALLKQVFLIAKHLKPSLNQAARQGRSCFMTVTRLDGAFGLAKNVNFGAIGAGLFGLTKTLNIEWKSVFCRGIDLSPELNAEGSAQYIMAELHDPNHYITEVGYSSLGRVTLSTEPSI
ncbi:MULTISPECIES: type I polyketide synthase [unclassified Moorena]|uniref:type I polyketide synthase n=1 Tax=unclassified Moorena TaxID=2683338 RepID=UPI0025EFB682|nr:MULTISPECIES: type I polyketide synthase [unclassified Moorena]